MTLVLPADAAESAGWSGTFRCAWITLRVRSALTAVGLTAAVSAALTRDGIACNVVAGFHHDHLFVPVGSGRPGDGRAGGPARMSGRRTVQPADGSDADGQGQTGRRCTHCTDRTH